MGELEGGEVGVCGWDLAEEAGEICRLDVLGWGGGGEGLVGGVPDGDVLGCDEDIGSQFWQGVF